jgi:hypothetical protein
MTKTKKQKPSFRSRLAFVLNFKILNFEFVSNFVLRASNLFLFALRFSFWFRLVRASGYRLITVRAFKKLIY